MITTRIIVRRKVWTTYSGRCPPGSGYCDEHHDRQYLTKEWRIGRFVIFRKVLDYEDVPLYVAIQIATIGSCPWRSKFPEEYFLNG